MQTFVGILLGLILLTSCARNPLVASGASSFGDAGAADDESGAGGSLGIAQIGDDGMCNGLPCPQGQQCCFSTGRCVPTSGGVTDCPALTPAPVVCGGVACPSGEICCLLNGNCIDPSSSAATCPRPGASSSADASSPRNSSVSCGSNADCLPTQFCAPPPGSLLCLGSGICQSRSNCGYNTTASQYCGCDGVSYPSVQAACIVGVRVTSDSSCGATVVPVPELPGAPRVDVVYCGSTEQCPRDQQCCSITGRCYDPNTPYLCTLPPPGTSIACVDDSQCTNVEFCSGPGCSGPGGCLAFSTGNCGGELSPVCGCDGRSYTNAGCADAVGVRVAHEGVCEAADAGL
jgi:hypothetical protein